MHLSCSACDASTSGREHGSAFNTCAASRSGQSKEQAWRERYRYHRYQKAARQGLPQVDWGRYNLTASSLNPPPLPSPSPVLVPFTACRAKLLNLLKLVCRMFSSPFMCFS